jgi:hypothetical protein
MYVYLPVISRGFTPEKMTVIVKEDAVPQTVNWLVILSVSRVKPPFNAHSFNVFPC